MRHSAEVMDHNASQEQRIKELEAIVKQQHSQLMELEQELNKKNDEIQELDKAFPIKVFGKIRGGQRGAIS
jgi:TolA-binding protein